MIYNFNSVPAKRTFETVLLLKNNMLRRLRPFALEITETPPQ